MKTIVQRLMRNMENEKESSTPENLSGEQIKDTQALTTAIINLTQTIQNSAEKPERKAVKRSGASKVEFKALVDPSSDFCQKVSTSSNVMATTVPVHSADNQRVWSSVPMVSSCRWL